METQIELIEEMITLNTPSDAIKRLNATTDLNKLEALHKELAALYEKNFKEENFDATESVVKIMILTDEKIDTLLEEKTFSDVSLDEKQTKKISKINLLEDIETAEVSPEIIEMLNKHIFDIPYGITGCKKVQNNGPLGLKNAWVIRESFSIEAKELYIPRGSLKVLIGPNGSGKSTFLDACVDQENATIDTNDGHGSHVVGKPIHKNRKTTRIAKLNQEEILKDIQEMTTKDVITQVAKFFYEQLETNEENDQLINDAKKRIEMLTSEILDLFSITRFLERKVKELSGGEKTKLALINMLMSEPDFGLFDEPTNHLDLVTISKLIGLFEKYKSAGISIICVSHVEWFLREAGKDGTLFIDKNGNNQSTIQSIGKNYAKLKFDRELTPTIVDEIEWYIGKPLDVITLKKMDNVQIENSPLQDISLPALQNNEIRILLGENGTGKTKLMETFANNSEYHEQDNVNIAYLPQFWPKEVSESNINIHEFFSKVFHQIHPRVDEIIFIQARNRFFGKISETRFKKRTRFKNLSGGEQRLLWFLMVSSIPDIDVLILDEPTNHMDKNMRNIIAETIQGYAANVGSVLLSSHDLDLLTYFHKKNTAFLSAYNFERDDDTTSIQRIPREDIQEHLQKVIEDAKLSAQSIKYLV